LVFEPALLLMDEPLSNLDAKLREQMRVELRALQQKLGITTVYVTHDQEEAMVLAAEIAVMHEGRLLQMAAPESIYTRPATRAIAAFFGTPNLLDAKVREVRREAAGSLARVEGEGWEGWCAAPGDLAAGGVVTVIVRSEAIQVGAGDRGEPGVAWTGIVQQRLFRGAHNVYVVRVGPHRLTVDAPPDRPFAVGAEIALRVAAVNLWAVRD
jgi:iron(III) transport system ATP-binding protein